MRHAKGTGMKAKDLIVFAGGAVCVVLVSLAVQAAPFMTPRAKIPDELQCLSGLASVQLEFQEIPEALAEQGLRMSEVETMSHRLLQDEGFDIVEDPTAPTLAISFRVMEDESVPGILGFATFVEVKQKVRLVRLDDDEMTLPTATLLAYGLKKDHDVSAAALRRLEFTIRKLVGFVSAASGKELDE